MTMTMRTATPTRPPKPERRKRRYTPLPDPPKKIDMVHLEILAEVHSILKNRYKRDPRALVGGEGYLRLYARDRSCYVVPDCLVSFDVEDPPFIIREIRGYSIDEIGKPPDFVIEIASESTGERDYTVKRRVYRNMGAVEYWRFDPSGGRYHDAPLAGDVLVDGEYQRIPIRAEPDGTHWGYSAALGLFLVWEEGSLRFYDPAVSRFLRNLDESEERVEEAEAEARLNAESAAMSDRRAAEAESEARANARRAAAERAARAEAQAEARANAESAAAERAARAEVEAARAEADRRADEAEAELERLRRLLGDPG